MQSRKNASLRNFIVSISTGFLNTLLNIVLRAIFVKTLGAELLGVNGLFSNVLGFLSLAELGIGAAIGFNLYKPLAENDINKIQALIRFYRSAYRVVALVVLVISIILIPFLPYIAKGAENVEHLTFIYCIYIFNTVSSYLITYKSTIITADQKMYQLTRLNFIANILTVIFQGIELLLLKDYIGYLLVASIIGLLRNIYINYYTNKHYPYLKEQHYNRLSKDEKSYIFMKIRAMMYHKIGEVVIFQTDSIITSSIINVKAVGLVSNYNMIINIIKSFCQSFYGSMNPSFGNLLATSDKEYQYKVFNRINFIGFWINGFTAICLYFLLNPFIRIWLGDGYLIDDWTLLLLIVNYYMLVMRIPVQIPKQASGLFEYDKKSPIIESLVNLIVSVVMAKLIGLPGIYIGTLLSCFVPTLWAPAVVYKHIFAISVKKYYVQYALRFAIVVGISAVIRLITNAMHFSNLYFNFIFIALLCIVIPNLLMILLYRKRDEFEYTVTVARGYIYKGLAIIKKH